MITIADADLIDRAVARIRADAAATEGPLALYPAAAGAGPESFEAATEPSEAAKAFAVRMRPQVGEDFANLLETVAATIREARYFGRIMPAEAYAAVAAARDYLGEDEPVRHLAAVPPGVSGEERERQYLRMLEVANRVDGILLPGSPMFQFVHGTVNAYKHVLEHGGSPGMLAEVAAAFDAVERLAGHLQVRARVLVQLPEDLPGRRGATEPRPPGSPKEET